MAGGKNLIRTLRAYHIYRLIALPYRAFIGAQVVFASVATWLKWIFTSREETNFTYELTQDNLLYLAHTIALVAGVRPEEVSKYVDELRSDKALSDQILASMRASEFRSVSDDRVGYSRRMGWYALVRIKKPKVVIETGVDKGLGATVLCAALKRNSEEGFAGKYYGTDIVPTAGWLLKRPYAEMGEILYGDSVESLRKLQAEIDIFINDSDHSADYEMLEYETILPKLSKQGIILADNAHATAKLAEFSSKHGRRFVYFGEKPVNHWYPGAGIGFSF